jgi:hypothetical protein
VGFGVPTVPPGRNYPSRSCPRAPKLHP